MVMIKGTNLGPTGKFPLGKCDPDDEGELAMAIGSNMSAKLVEIAFGKKIAWIKLPPDEARGFAELILKHANEIDP